MPPAPALNRSMQVFKTYQAGTTTLNVYAIELNVSAILSISLFHGTKILSHRCWEISERYMKRLFIICLSFLLAACSTVPKTGRSQLDLVPDNQMLSLSESQYKDFLSQNKLSTDAEKTAMVQRVSRNVANAVEQYLKDNGQAEKLKDYKWEFNLIESKEVNAWAMPGGKIVVYEGIIPLAGNDDGLAVVLGHEIAHAVAHHGNERMSQGLITQLGGTALQVALANKPQQTQQLFMSVFGAASNVGFILPYSRLHESEADYLGLIFMAMAGYDPQTAIPFWQKMAAQGGNKPPEFLSTHPSDETRIRDIQAKMGEAMSYYNSSVKK